MDRQKGKAASGGNIRRSNVLSVCVVAIFLTVCEKITLIFSVSFDEGLLRIRMARISVLTDTSVLCGEVMRIACCCLDVTSLVSDHAYSAWASEATA